MKKAALLLIILILTLMLVGCNKKNGDNTATVTYTVNGKGAILGASKQDVEIGGDATTVIAVANEGWIFVGWDDGYPLPSRTDKGITESVSYTAIFAEGETDEEDPDDTPADAPVIPEPDLGIIPDEE